MHSVIQIVVLVGNIYGVALPHAEVVVWDGDRAIRTATADANGEFLINAIPTGDDGRDYTITSGDVTIAAHVLPGASMALEVDLTRGTWRYRHELEDRVEDRLQSVRTDRLKTVPHSTYGRSIFATREGLVGGTTANGHVIVTNDHFAALPSRRALNQMVRLTYNGRTVTVPVWDIGPWNTHDDYWNPAIIRETFKDLPRGMPESEAAFTTHYNNGLDERGRVVKNPAGIDLADGTFWFDLGLTNNDRVNVEYLWLDETGPVTGSVNATHSNNVVTVDAQVSDASPISAAEMFIDGVGENGTGLPLTPTDGAFDSPTENVHGVVGVLPPGAHVIYVHARDAYGNWGAFTTTTVSISGNVTRRRSVRHS